MYAPIMRTLIRNLQVWSQYLNVIVIHIFSWIIVSKSFWISYLSKGILISWFLKELICVLLYLGKNVFDLRVRLTRIIEGNLPYCQLKVIFRSKGRLNTLFRFKDLLEKKIRPFTSELLNTWESLFLQENALKT